MLWPVAQKSHVAPPRPEKTDQPSRSTETPPSQQPEGKESFTPLFSESTRKFFRLSGLAGLFYGALLVFQFYFYNSLAPRIIQQSASYNSWLSILKWSGYPGLLAFLFILTGIYLRQKHKTGILGTIGVGLLIAGSSLFIGYDLLSRFSFNYLVIVDLSVLVIKNQIYETYPLLLICSLSIIIGYLLFTIATIRAGIFPRLAASLLFASGVLTINRIFPDGTLYLLQNFSLVIAMIWLGFVLWKEKLNQA
jgi:hypothetical protein